jgi:hypothetical protein
LEEKIKRGLTINNLRQEIEEEEEKKDIKKKKKKRLEINESFLVRFLADHRRNSPPSNPGGNN